MALITGLKGGTTNITVSYGGKTATFSNFTVNKKTVTFSAPTLKTVSAYTRSPQVLVNAGSCTTGGTMYYYVSTSSSMPTFSTSSWTTTVPSKTNAGTYYLWYTVYVSDLNTYTGTGINTVTKVGTGSVTIGKQTPVLSTSPTKRANWTYNGTEYALASGGAMKHSSTDSTAVAGTFTYAKGKNAGSYTASWSFTPTDTTNYNSTSGNVGTVTVSKATPTFTTTNGSVEYHNTAYAQGKPSVAGKIYWGTSTSSMTSTVSASANTNTNITSRTAVGTTTIYAYFVPTDTTNYNSVGSSSSGYKTITAAVTKATDAEVIVVLASDAGKYGSTATLITTPHSTSHGTSAAYVGYKYGSAATADNQITWVSVGTELTLSETASAGTYYIYKKWTADSNHSNSQTYTQVDTLQRSKADQVVSIRRSATIYVHSGHTYNNTVNVDATGIGTITYSSSATGKATVNSSGLVTAVAAGTATITATAAGNTNYKSGSASCTVTVVTDTVSSYGKVSTPTVSQKANFPAGGVTLTSSNMSTYFTASGSAQTNTWASGYTSSGSVSYSWSVSSGAVASKGTTISNASTVTINATVTATGDGSETASKSVTSGTQVGNYVTAITPKSSSNTDGTHFSYANIGAGATSASPSLSGGALYTFSSGSTTFNSSSSPSFGGSASYSRSYTLASSQNGFTAVNSSTGVLTATSRGKTTGAARTSANVTGTLVVTYTHASSYSAGGTVTSSTKSNTQTCTQNANYLTWGDITLTVSSPATPYSMAVSGETKAITASATQSATYSSGSTDIFTPTISYTVKTAKNGYSLSSNSVTVTNNTSTSARDGFVVTVTATGKTGTNSTYESGYNKTATSDRTFKQAAGTKHYGTPTVTFTYTNTAASGVTNKAPTTVTYSQPWTWNGVSGSGGNITSGLTLSYSTTGTLPTGFSKGTNFATTGAITWASRGTTVGSQLNANSNVVLSIPFADQTRTYNPTGCTQGANALTGISISFGSNPINYNTTTTTTVTATYTSGSSKDVTSSLSTSSSATSNFIKSGDTSVVTIS